MSDRHHQFVRCNLMSPVAKITTGKRLTTYTLEDGNVFRLDKAEMERFGEWIARNGFTIRLTDELKKQFPGDHR